MKKEIVKPGPAGFITSNASLALALHKAGVPFADPRKPCRNWYSAEILFRIGGGQKDDDGNVIRSSRYAGMSLEDAAAQAFEEGEKGHVDFVFQHPKGLSKLCAAYADQEREIKEKDVIGVELLDEISKRVADGTMSPQEGKIRSTCVDQKMRGPFMNQWRNQVPMIKIDNPGRVTTHKTTVTVRTKDGLQNVPATGHVHPGFKLVNLNLSEKKRKHIGL